MVPARDLPIPYRIVALIQERNRLFSYPLGQAAADIISAGFRCTCCGACCTQAVNNHVFLLDRDLEGLKTIDPEAYKPAPDPEFCDQNGMLYGSGYAIRTRDDERGSCWFLEDGRCRIYEQRFSGCRVYPHILHRCATGRGNISWRQQARSGTHGSHDHTMTPEEGIAVAREVVEYENAILSHQIAFLETVHDYFSVHNLRHDPGVYTERMQQIRMGRPAEIRVYHAGDLEPCRIE